MYLYEYRYGYELARAFDFFFSLSISLNGIIYDRPSISKVFPTGCCAPRARARIYIPI